MERKNMNATMEHYGPWQIAVAVKRCLCPDGKRRYVRITGQPVTYFAIPGKVNYRGKSITGFVTGVEGEDGGQDFKFSPCTYRKNGKLFE